MADQLLPTRRTLLQGLGLAASAGLLRARDLGDGTYLNPIIGGDHPDAGAIRVGSDYYLTHSSFDYAPGLPIWRSRDLVNWELVSYGLKRYYGNVWAPYLCEYKGEYYIYYPSSGGLAVIHSPSPTGPYSEPVPLHIEGIDPAHIADASGRRFLHFSGGRVAELAPDGLSAISEVRQVFQPWKIPADWRVECVCLEAPKLTYKDGYYYLMVAEGGTAGPATAHMAIAARSRHADGPFEYSPYNPIVHTRSREERWRAQGHARLVEAVDKSWWITFHAYEKDHLTLGRQTLLLPIEWTKDGWFRVPEGISPQKPIRKPPGERVTVRGLSDEFKTTSLALQWQSWHDLPRQKFTTGNGVLALEGGGADLPSASILCCAVPDHRYEVEVDLELEGQAEGGLVLFYDPAHASGLYLDSRGIGLRRVIPNSPRQDEHQSARRATLKLINDNEEVEAWYRLPGKDWVRIDRAWDVAGINHNTLGEFLSLRPALYACGNGRAVYRGFRYRSL
jgi:xylan 1,4-beta-xylosidase